MKKCLSLLLILLLTLTAVPVLAEEAVWDFSPDQFRLTGYEGPGGDVVIPAEIDGAPVRFVDYHVFNSRSDITSVTFPDSVQLIDGNVCCWVSSLTSLTLPESLQIIGDGCFQDLEALNALTVPASVLYIGSGAFSDAYSLQTVTFEGLCPIMTGDAFDSLPESAVVYVPDDQTDAYAAAFADLGLTVNLQASGREAVVVELPEKPEDFSFDPFTGTVIDYHGAGDYVVNVPKTIDGTDVLCIGDEAFCNAYEDPKFVILPEGLELIGRKAMKDPELYYVRFPSTLKSIDEYAFGAGYYGCRIDLPQGLESIGKKAFYYSNISGVLELPEGLKSLGGSAFANCQLLEKVILPSTLTEIGEGVFEGCEMLTEAVVRFDPALLPENTFADCGDVQITEEAAPVAEVPVTEAPAAEAPAGLEGDWNLVQVVMDGVEYSPADFGMEMTITLLADGSASTDMNGESAGGSWHEDGETVYITIDGEEIPFTAQDGLLSADSDGMVMVFSREAAAPAFVPAAAIAADSVEAFNGVWLADMVEADGMTIPAEGLLGELEALLGVTDLRISVADGTASCLGKEPKAFDFADGRLQYVVEDNGVIDPELVNEYIDLREDGSLSYQIMGMTFYCSKTDEQPEIAAQPAPEPVEEQPSWLQRLAEAGKAAAPTEPAPEPAAEPVSEPAPDSGSADLFEIKYVCTQADVNGMIMDAALLGGEYSIRFHEDGTADFVLVGREVPGLAWTQDGDAFVVDYFGQIMTFEPSAEGFTMNFFGSMIMTFVPEN